MKIGFIIPVGRTDKYGYQYENFTRLIIDEHEKFADHIIVVSSSRYANKELFENRSKIEFISNEKTWFELVDGEEIFSFQILSKMVNLALYKLQEEGYDVAISIHINQYIPKTSYLDLRKSCLKMIKKKRKYTWLYKSYQIGSLLFNADRKLPWILNLNLPLKWEYGPDSLVNKENKKVEWIQSGNFKKYNSQAIRDVYGELTINDIKQKHEYTLKELYILNNMYDPNHPELFNPDFLKFNEKRFWNHIQRKFNVKKILNEPFDEIGKEILKMRKEEFISNIIEKNYAPRN